MRGEVGDLDGGQLWDLPELLDGILSAKPCGTPEKKPIAMRPPVTTARPLPNGRGFLRVVPGAAGSVAPSPAPAPATPPAAPVAPAAPVQPGGAPAVDPRQLDLLAWRPTPAKPPPSPGTQLDLFADPNPTSR